MAVANGVADVVVAYRSLNGRSWHRLGGGGAAGWCRPPSQRRPVLVVHPVRADDAGRMDGGPRAALHAQVGRDVGGLRTCVRPRPQARREQPARALLRDSRSRSRTISARVRSSSRCGCSTAASRPTAPSRSSSRPRSARRTCKQTPAVIAAAAQGATPGQPTVTDYYRDDITTLPEVNDVAEQLWRQSGLGPDDIQCANLYDHFTPLMLIQLEELGFCARGEAKEFVRDGNLELDGKLPTNTNGGQLAEAYIHGMNGIAEGVRQIRGTSSNQVDERGARPRDGRHRRPDERAHPGERHERSSAATRSATKPARSCPSSSRSGARDEGLAEGDELSREQRRSLQRFLAEHGWGVPTWPVEFGGRGLGMIEYARLEPSARPRPASSTSSTSSGWDSPGRRSSRAARPSRRTNTSARSRAATRRGASSSASPVRAPTSARSRRAPNARTTGGSSTDRRCGAPARSNPTAGCSSRATTGTCRSRRDSSTSCSTCTRRASTCARCVRSTAARTSPRCSSTTCSSRTADRVGEPGEGWAVAMTTLLHERSSIGGGIGSFAMPFEQIVALARSRGRASDPLSRQRLVDVYARKIDPRRAEQRGSRRSCCPDRSRRPRDR